MSTKRLTILLIEDEPAHALLIRRAFESHSKTVDLFVAYSLKEARTNLTKFIPDLVISDLRLPDGQGIEFLSSDKSDLPYPVVIMTSHGDEQAAVEAIKAGALDYVVKSEDTFANMPYIAERALREWGHITERRRAEESLKKYSETLEDMVEARTKELKATQKQLVRQEKLAILGQLASGVAHELRNPLGVITNAIYFLQLSLPDVDETIKEYLDIISTRTHDVEKTVLALLDFTHIRTPQRKQIAVSTLITKTLKKYPAPKHVLIKQGEITNDLPHVYVDYQQIEQVLSNLITNAYHAVSDGGELSINAQAQQDHVSLVITDTGRGMSPQTLQKIFEPLFTTKAKGIGLGLAISKNLVEINGGSIEGKSLSGKGSTFIVRLPVKR